MNTLAELDQLVGLRVLSAYAIATNLKIEIENSKNRIISELLHNFVTH